jgi:adenine-specific DNA methylase
MLSRYLGNKTAMIDPILEEVQRCVPPTTSSGRRVRVGDLFSGTMSVSLALKRAGYDVVASDVQAFSGVVGEAFLVATSIPSVPHDLVPPGRGLSGYEALLREPGFRFLSDREQAAAYFRVLDVLEYLEGLEISQLPKPWRRSHVFDTYTEAGRNSEFRSSRGTAGRRRFFSPENGRRIDAVLNQIRCWWRTEAIDRELYVLLVCLSPLI